MAQDLTGLYENNRRREVNGVTGKLPFVLAPASLREGTAAVNAISDVYTLGKIPAGVVITGAYLVVTDAEVYGALSTATIEIGATTVLAATTIAAGGVTAGTVPLLLDSAEDLKVTLVVAGTATDNSNVNVVVEYIDYNRATMSYLGEG